MGITAVSGPYISYGITQNSTISGTGVQGLTGTPTEYNEERAPSLFDLGIALEDPRTFYGYQPGNPTGISATGTITPHVFGFFNSRGFVDYVPTTVSTQAFQAGSAVSTGVTSLTITASSGLGTFNVTIIAPETGQSVTTIAIGSSQPMYTTYGSAGSVAMWNPAAGTGRCISITTSSSGDGGTWSVSGRDMYGYKMTETIGISQGASNSSGFTVIGQKAFKYISGISNTSTPTSTSVAIGISDVYGMPFKVPYCGEDLRIRILASAYSSAVSVTVSSSTFTLPSTAATQTSTTPDVRGTYASTTASNNTVRLQIAVTPSVATMASIGPLDVSALFGGTQYSSV